MPLMDQVLSISFDKGLDTKVDPKQVMPGEMLVLQNATFISPKEISQDPGSAAVSQTIYNGGGSISAGNSIFTFNNQLIMSDGKMVYPLSETMLEWVSNAKDSIKVANSISNSFISSIVNPNNNINTSVGFAVATNGIEMYSFVDGGNYNVVLYDPLEGTILYKASISLGEGMTTLRNFFASGVFYGFFVTESTNAVRAFTISPSTPTSPVPITLISGLVGSSPGSQTPNWVDITGNVGLFYIVYNNSSGTHLSAYDGTFTLTATTVLTSSNSAPVSVTTGPLTNDVYVSYYRSGVGAFLGVYTSNLSNVTLPTPVFAYSSGFQSVAMTGVVDASGANFHLFVQTPVLFSGAGAANAQTITEWVCALPGLGTITAENFIFNASMYSNAYLFNGYPYIELFFADPANAFGSLSLQQQVFFSAQITSSATGNLYINYVAKYAEGTATGQEVQQSQDTQYGIVTQVVVNGSVSLHPYLLIVSSTENAIVNVARLQTTLGTKIQGSTLGNNLNLTGGILSIWDGFGIAENGFNAFPSLLGEFSSSATGGSWSNGTYSFVATYEWTDIHGNLVRSSPSAAFSFTFSGGTTTQSLTLFAAGLSLSEPYKLPNVIIKFWGTTNGGTVYFLLGSIPNTPSEVEFVANPPNTAGPELYTTGGEVDNIAPPATNLLTSFKNRLIAVQADSPYVWWYSKQNIQGFPAEFSDAFTQNIDEFGGPISAVTVMDDKLIFFKNSFIYYVIGDGPAPSGANNDFTYPQRVTTDVGCINQSSLIVIPIGIMFQSTDKGIFLLDRSMQVSYIGAPVEAFNSFTVTSVVLLPNTTQVRFSLNTSTLLIYDYLVQQWSVHTGLTFVDSTIYKEQSYQLQASGQVLELIPGQYFDNGGPVILSFTTGWFSFAQKQGFQRIKQFQLLLTSVNTTSIQIQMFYDFNPNIMADTVLIPIAPSSIPQKFRIFPSFQKCTSMQIVLTEIPTNGVGGGLTISGLTFNIGVKKGPSKLPAAQTYG